MPNRATFTYAGTAPGVKHLNPRQGITTGNGNGDKCARRYCESVKHLNPRQGITTAVHPAQETLFRQAPRVKHLNPRQGITTAEGSHRHKPTNSPV